ncbi:TetR/AcrR family transcriptional regulator [Paenarthrobacter sp. MSM-2-10-13]|uniref:TetR/AcrR family transcriptional regulator n=1 Tax=Micrococcaceae TaxID=1268 RepID=UPI00141F1A49|nr:MULTISPECIES: TetR/AcrR family transcriptional regulator [Micrococcaceae]NHW48436.1 TetR/AcrR family transcriptional regulator [Paenarthrobacter sp. MSM-2-10-13]BCW64877.1 putative transcriptional regulator, TetR family protein [Arthrobacter sp. StoSoilB22]
MPATNSLEPYSLDLTTGLPRMAAAPTTPRQQLRYARILKTAEGFAQRQFDTLSLSDVAARADIPLGTLYRYFPSTAHLMLAVYRQQLRELRDGVGLREGKGHALAGLMMEIFHLRVMQPGIEHCLIRPAGKDDDTAQLLREIDALSEEVVGSLSKDQGKDTVKARILLHLVSGLVQAVRCRRLSLFEAEKDLKKACTLLSGE